MKAIKIENRKIKTSALNTSIYFLLRFEYHYLFLLVHSKISTTLNILKKKYFNQDGSFFPYMFSCSSEISLSSRRQSAKDIKYNLYQKISYCSVKNEIKDKINSRPW